MTPPRVVTALFVHGPFAGESREVLAASVIRVPDESGQYVLGLVHPDFVVFKWSPAVLIEDPDPAC